VVVVLVLGILSWVAEETGSEFWFLSVVPLASLITCLDFGFLAVGWS